MYVATMVVFSLCHTLGASLVIVATPPVTLAYITLPLLSVTSTPFILNTTFPPVTLLPFTSVMCAVRFTFS